MSYNPIPGFCTSDDDAVAAINCIWLDTLYWSFYWNFKEAKICDCIGSPCLKFPQLDSLFFLQVHKASDTSFTVQLHRIVEDDTPDDGFVLHFMLSIVGLRTKPVDEYLKSSDSYFSLSCDFNPENMSGHYCWVIKCCCEMYEITNLENEASETQNELIENVKRRKANEEYKLSSMGNLLRRPGFRNVFSGRQSYEFAEAKVEIIDRSVDFADEIMLLYTALAAGMTSQFENSGTPLSAILGYIYRKNLVSIKNREVLVLYYMAYHYGLRYLKTLCREFISKNLRTIKSIINAFVVCDVLCDDSSLLTKLYEEYSRRANEILSSRNWENLALNKYPIADSIIDTFIRLARERESRTPGAEAAENENQELINLTDMINMLSTLLV